jgi:hypothetical protein
MKMNIKRMLLVGACVTVLGVGLLGTQIGSVNAQGPGGGPMGVGMMMLGAVPCSTTDYTEITAKALGISASELRLALVSGKTIQELAAEKNVTIETVNAELEKARQADLDQAKKDGLITDDTMLFFSIDPGMPYHHIEIEIFDGRGRGMFGMGGMHLGASVNTEVVAAQAIGVTCPELVKAMQQGKTIVQVATEKNVQVQVVIDAIVKAHTNATAQAVKEGLITQAQADGHNRRLVERVTQMISMPHMGGLHMGGMGRRMIERMEGMIGKHGRMPGRGMPGRGQPGHGGPGGRPNQPVQPTVTPTPQS